MLYSLLFALVLIAVVLVKYVCPPPERCPECHAVREADHPICACGYVFEFPDQDDDDGDFEYAESEDFP